VNDPTLSSPAERLASQGGTPVRAEFLPIAAPDIGARERELVLQALKETSGNQVQAAKLLGITRATLRKRVEKFKIQREVSIK
jgi:transcriptional regulator with GAF, ATPase, and Fis domain